MIQIWNTFIAYKKLYCHHLWLRSRLYIVSSPLYTTKYVGRRSEIFSFHADIFIVSLLFCSKFCRWQHELVSDAKTSFKIQLRKDDVNPYFSNTHQYKYKVISACIFWNMTLTKSIPRSLKSPHERTPHIQDLGRNTSSSIRKYHIHRNTLPTHVRKFKCMDSNQNFWKSECGWFCWIRRINQTCASWRF